MVMARSHVRVQIAWLALIDLVCLIIGGAAGIIGRLGHGATAVYAFERVDGWMMFFGGVILANYLAGSYRVQYTFSRFNLVVTWLFSLVFALFILSITSYAWFMVVLGRGVLLISVVVYSIVSLSLKMLVYRALFRSERFTCRSVIIGSGKSARFCRRIIEKEFVLPAHKAVAFISVLDTKVELRSGSDFNDGVVVIYASPDKLEEVVNSLGIDLIILALDDMSKANILYPQLKHLRFNGMGVLSPLHIAEIYSGMTPLEYVDEELLMQVSMESRLLSIWRLKRISDILISLFAIILFMPLFLLVTLIMKILEPRSSIMYSQEREGRFGVPFTIYKLRTMKHEAEKDTGPVWAADNDERITWFGRILRKTRIDEIPQFFNILRGEMSLVGPRPERTSIINQIEKDIPFYRERENVVPGLTGWAQIRYHYGSSVEDAKRKLEYDLYYIKHLSLSLDLQIILSTLRIVLFGKERSK